MTGDLQKEVHSQKPWDFPIIQLCLLYKQKKPMHPKKQMLLIASLALEGTRHWYIVVPGSLWYQCIQVHTNVHVYCTYQRQYM